MAVKQNNTDSNGVPTPVNDNNSNGSNGSTGGASNATGAVNVANMSNGGVVVGGSNNGVVTKSQKSASNMEEGGVNIESVPCGANIDGINAKGLVNTNLNDKAGLTNKNNINNDMSNNSIMNILNIINCVEGQRKQISHNEWLPVYHHILVMLSRVPLQRQSAEDLKRFKEDIGKVGAFFANTTDQGHYLFYLRTVCQIVMQTNLDGPPPSCAIAIIFQLFSPEMVLDAVQSLLDMNNPDQNLKQTVHVLCDWMRMCTFCNSLNLWICAILTGLQKRKKFALFDDICLQNIDLLFMSLILPIFRPKVAPVFFHMLYTTQQPLVFHKILPKFPRLLLTLQQQVNLPEEHAEETKKVFQELIDITTRLLVRFPGYGALYEPIIESIKDICPSYNYMRSQKDDDDYNISSSADELIDAGLHSKNVKVGLVNLGNTCYMNSVLQALAMTKEFAREILMYQSASPLLIKMRQQIALMLYSQRYELTPTRVLNDTRPPGFQPGLQQDSSEFLGYLLETLHEEDITTRKAQLKHKEINGAENVIEPTAKSSKPGAEYIENNGTKNNNTSSTCNTNCESSDNKTVVTLSDNNTTANGVVSTVDNIFTGKLATTYKCLTCGWKSRNVDSFRDLQLSFPEVKNDCASNYSVQDLIDYYCSPEKLDGDNQYYCERCKKLSDAERYINVISAPKNLILTLKHFKYDQKYHMRAKLMHKVFHDEKITVKVCSVETLDEVTTVHYDLYAGVVHSGFSMDSGHYYTYASDATNKWFKFNDNIVTSSKSEELHNLTPPNTPYILFYQMCARSCPENQTNLVCNASALPENSGELVNVETPMPLALEELPPDLREYVNHDNCLFAEELRLRRFKVANRSFLRNGLKANSEGGSNGDSVSRGYNNYDDDDNDPPPSAGGCGGNALNINVNRFVY